MARGQSQAADQQRALTNQKAGEFGSRGTADYGTLSTQANQLINSTGFDPATLSAITNAGMGAVNSGFGDAVEQIKRTAATSGNPASLGAQFDALARSKGIAGGKEAGDIQIANAQERDMLRKQGLDLLNSLYGTNTGAETSLYGQGVGALNARAAGPSGAQDFASILNSITGAAPGGHH